MDENTINYLLASLGIKCKDYGTAKQFASSIVTSRSAQAGLKEKARGLLGQIKAMNRIKTVFQKLWSYETFHIFMYSIALNAVIECLNNRGLTGLLKIFTSPVIFLMNTLIIMTTLSIGLFFKRRIFVYVLMAVLWIILAFINFCSVVFTKDTIYSDGYISYK